MGSACLFFDVSPKKALLTDINDQLIKTYKTVKRDPTGLAAKLTTLEKSSASYYRLRDQDPMDLDPIDSAARFIFLNRFCFNGLYRTNQKGDFNVPYSPSRTGSLPNEAQLVNISKTLKNCTLKASDFETTVNSSGRGDFVYLDPPFAVKNRRIFRQYGPDTFGLNDLERLATSLQSLHNRGGTFVLSYAYCREALDLFSKWKYKKLFVRRNISGFAKSRRMAAELIFTNSDNDHSQL